MIYRRAAMAAALLLLISGQAFSADCLMGRYDPSQTGFTSEKLQLPLRLNWEFVGNKFENNPAAPVVSGDTVVFACGDRVYAVDLATGSQKWRYPSDQGLTGSVKGTPAIHRGDVFFGAGENLYCISLETGTFKWAYQTRGAIRCAPVISDGVIFFGSDDNRLYAVNAETGEAQWDSFAARDDIAVGLTVGSGLAIVTCMDGNTYGVLASSGRLRWQPFRLPAAPTETSPIMSESTTIIAVASTMYGLAARSGQLRWMVRLPAEVAATPAVLGVDVFVPCKDKKIYAYSTAGRRPAYKWAVAADLGVTPMSSPTIAGDTVWVTGAKGTVAGYSVEDGSLRWRYTFLPSMVTTPGAQYCDVAASATVANGALLALTDDGVLHCFTPDAADNVAPVAFGMAPASGTAMSGAPPIKMSASLYDVGSGVDPGSVSMLLDGQPVASLDKPLFDPTTGVVSYETPMGDTEKRAVTLKDGLHTITVIAKDYAGNEIKSDWILITDSSLPPPRRTTPVADPGKKTKEPPKKTETPRTPPNFPGPPNQGNQGNMEMPPPPPPPPAPMPAPGGGEAPQPPAPAPF